MPPVRHRILALAFAAVLLAVAPARARIVWNADQDADSTKSVLNLHHFTWAPIAEPNTGTTPRCWFDAPTATFACRNPVGTMTHGVQTSLPGGNFVIGIGADGYVYRGGVSANQVAGLWPVAITGNGSDLNLASTPINRLIPGTVGQVLVTGAGPAPAWDTVGTAGLAAGAVTYAKLQSEGAGTFLCNPAAAPGSPGECTVGSGLTLSVGGVLSAAVAALDHKVQVDGADGTPDYLANKLIATSPVTLTVTATGPPVTGLKAWVKADAVTTSGSLVTAWPDQSGNGNGYASPSGHQPTVTAAALNGLPGITFDGSTTYLTGGPNLEGASYAFIVFQAASTPHSGYSILTVKGTSPATKFAEFMFDLAGGGYRPYDFANDMAPATPTAGVGSTTAASTSAQAFEWSYNGTGPTTSTGAYTAAVNGTGQTIVTDTTGLGRASTDQASIGARVNSGGTGTFFFAGKIYEILIYDHVLTATDYDNARGYLQGRWGITIAGATGTTPSETIVAALQPSALSVLGVAGSTSANPAYIAATAGGNGVFRESGSAIGFGNIIESSVINLVTDLASKLTGTWPTSGRVVVSGGTAPDSDANFTYNTGTHTLTSAGTTILSGTTVIGSSTAWLKTTAGTVGAGTWPTSGQVVSSNGTDPVGDSTFTLNTSTHLVSVDHLTISGVDGAGYALLMNKVGAQIVAKHGGLLMVGTDDANDFEIVTNGVLGLTVKSGGTVVQFNQYGTGIAKLTSGTLGLATSGDIAAALTWPAVSQILVSAGTSLAPVGDSTWTLNTASHLVTGDHMVLTGADGFGYAISMTKTGAQFLAKSGGTLGIGTSSADDVILNTSGLTRQTWSSAGAITFNGFGTGIAKLTSGALGLATSGDIAGAIGFPASGQILVSAGASAAPVGDSTFTENTGTHLVTGDHMVLTSVDGSGYALLLNRAGAQAVAKTGGTFTIGTGDANSFVISTNGTTRVTFDSGGGISIPGADAFGYALHLTKSGTQVIAKTSGELDVGTDDANPVVIKTNGAASVTVASGGTVTFGAYGSGMAKLVSGALALATAGTDYQAPLSFPASTDVLVSTGTGIAGDATFTENTSTHLLSADHLVLTGVDGSGYALLLNKVAAQTVAKTGGTFTIGTGDANSFVISTNGGTRATFDSGGGITLPGSDASGYVLHFTKVGTQVLAKTSGQLTVGTDDANAVVLSTNGTARYTISSGGSVTFNAYGSGLAKLTSGTLALATAGTDYQAPITWPTAGDVLISSGPGVNPTADPLFVVNTGTHAVSADHLIIPGKDGASYAIYLDGAFQQDIAKHGGLLLVGTDDANGVEFVTNGSDRMDITSGGNVTVTNDLSVGGVTASSMVATDSGHFLSPVTVDSPLSYSGGHLSVSASAAATFIFAYGAGGYGVNLPSGGLGHAPDFWFRPMSYTVSAGEEFAAFQQAWEYPVQSTFGHVALSAYVYLCGITTTGGVDALIFEVTKNGTRTGVNFTVSCPATNAVNSAYVAVGSVSISPGDRLGVEGYDAATGTYSSGALRATVTLQLRP